MCKLDDNQKKQLRKTVSILKLVFLFVLIALIPIYIFFEHPEFVEHFKSLEQINVLLQEYKTTSIFAYIGLQIIQIVISVLPGQALQFAAGYAYSFLFGYVLSLIGVALGTVITFYLARILGKDAMHVIFGEEKFAKFVHILNSKRAYTILFVIFIIPGIPKDLFTYAAGVSEIKIRPFLILSILGRSPAMIGSIMMGSMFRSGSYTGLIILSVISVVACIVGLLHKDRIIKWSDKAYNRLIRISKD